MIMAVLNQFLMSDLMALYLKYYLSNSSMPLTGFFRKEYFLKYQIWVRCIN